MLSWFTEDIAYFFGYAVLGILGLALLVHRPYLSRWARFFIGLVSIAYGTLGFISGSQLLHSIETTTIAMPWLDDTLKLAYAAAYIKWASLVVQFAFAAVGTGLIVNSITADKKFEPAE